MAGAWGCPPDIIFSPFLARKGDRGMVERVFHHPASVKGRVEPANTCVYPAAIGNPRTLRYIMTPVHGKCGPGYTLPDSWHTDKIIS